ncbi:MAG: phosphatase PAP2 family protein [Clostridia bacterium]|nr:phosphatase PAP2 family protein [Clostridia bacterium]
MFDAINTFEIGILDWIQKVLGSPFCDTFFTYVTKLGDKGYIWIAIGIILLIFKKTRKFGVLLFVALILETIICKGVLKFLFERVRPYDFVGGYDLLIPKLSSFSFPSGHTMSSVVSATVLTLCNKKYGLFAIPIAVLISFSRLYLYVHYPSDVIIAAILGIILGVLVYKIGIRVSIKIKPKNRKS